MFPIHDENPTDRIPWVTWLLIAVNLCVFGYELWLLASGTGALDRFLVEYSFVPARFLASPFSPAQWLTVLTAMFMHGGLIHVGGNMLYLWIFGNNVEDRLGPVRFVGFYLLCGAVAALVQGAVDPTSSVPNLGASGAVAGVLGAYLILFPRARVTTLIFLFIVVERAALPAWGVILGWFLLQLAQGIGSLGAATASAGGVAYFAHIGGFLAGLALALPLVIRRRRSPLRAGGWR